MTARGVDSAKEKTAFPNYHESKNSFAGFANFARLALQMALCYTRGVMMSDFALPSG